MSKKANIVNTFHYLFSCFCKIAILYIKKYPKKGVKTMPVNSKHIQYNEHIEEWRNCRLFYHGEKAVKAETTRFLPKPERATAQEYQNYVSRAFFFPAVNRTVDGLTGAIDRKAPTVELPTKLEYIKENADSNFATLRQFSKIVLDEQFITGRAGILVERDPGGSRPYMIMYEAENILNWAVDSEQRVTMVVLREYFYESKQEDPFVQTRKQRFRVLRMENGRYIQQIYSEFLTETKDLVIEFDNEIEPTKAGIPLSDIPFVFVNPHSITPKIDKPPLLDLVLKNCEHYRVCADYANSLYLVANPFLVVKGVTAPKTRTSKAYNLAGELVQEHTGLADYNEPTFNIAIGSTRAVFLPADADIKLLESTGHGVNPNKDRANDIKLEMAVLGARLLENQRTGVETAETAQLRQSGETSTLSNIVVNVSAAIKKALMLLAEWENVDGSEIDFTLNTDFVDTTINPQLVSTLADLVQREYISWDTFYHNLATGELTVPGRTPDEERQEIQKQPPLTTPNANDFSGLQIDDGSGTPDNLLQMNKVINE